MRGYDLDKVIERRGTGCLKYDHGAKRRGRDDLLPLWIADMDFALPEEILTAIKKRTDHGIFGYTEPDEKYYKVLSDWFVRHYGYDIDEKRNTVTPGVVFAIAAAIRAFTLPGDGSLYRNPFTILSGRRSSLTEEGPSTISLSAKTAVMKWIRKILKKRSFRKT